MDLVDWERSPYDAIAADAAEHGSRLGIEVSVVPVSALLGDNIASHSPHTPWYTGPTVLELLETLPSADQLDTAQIDAAQIDAAQIDIAQLDADAPVAGWRFPVQHVLRPQGAAISDEYREYRGYAGQVAQGVIRVGDEVVVQPSGRHTSVSGIDTADGPLATARAGQSIALRLADNVDVARGDLLSSAHDAARAVKNIDAHVAWLSDRPLLVRDRVLVQHGTALVQAMVTSISGVLDISLPGGTLDSSIVPGDRLALNDIGVVSLLLASPLAIEDYSLHRRTGAFVLVDPQDGTTLAAGTARAATPGTGPDGYLSI